MTEINVMAVTNQKTLGAGVGLVVGDRKPEYMTANEARMLAMNLIGAADAAEAEAIFLAYAKGEMDLSGDLLETALATYRRFRQVRAENAATQAATG